MIMAFALAMFTACSPDDYDMGAKDLTSADLQQNIAFSVEHDASNPNIIHLKNLLKGRQALWLHPGVGLNHSKGDSVDLKIAFAGTYPVVYGVETAGGVVYSDTVKVKIDNFCVDFVSSGPWVYLTGGPGKSKTWVPDNGKYGYKSNGFYSCFDPSATYADMTADAHTPNDWYAKDKTWWQPSNSDVGITADDLAQYMTFSLENGTKLTTKDFNGNVTSGSFSFDPTAMTLGADGTIFAHGAWADGKSLSWSKNFNVLVLTENQLMIANHRDPGLSGEGDCLYVWNFVSKEIADNTVVPTVDPEPTLDDGWKKATDMQGVTKKKWKISADSPFDWFNLDGSRKNAYAKSTDYPSYMTPVSGLDNLLLTMDYSDSTYTFKNGDDMIATGKWAISDKGFFTFSNGLGTTLLGGDWVNLSTDANNQLRYLQYDIKSSTKELTGLWLGKKEFDNNGDAYQYIGYHFVPVIEGVVSVPTYEAQLHFSDSNWSWQTSDVVSIEKEGQYTVTINGTSSDPYIIYMDVLSILADHPKATLTFDDMKVDGTSIASKIDLTWWHFTQNKADDGTISQMVGDLTTTARIYPCNPWDTTAGNPVTDKHVFNFTTSLSMTFTVKFND